MRKRTAVFTLFALLLGALLAVSGGVVHWEYPPEADAPRAIPKPKTFSEAEARAIWARMRPPREVVDIRGIRAASALRILTDVDDDGIIDDSDGAAREMGGAEIVRLDDAICNGRAGVYDRSLVLDDDLQLITLQLPSDALDTDTLSLASDSGSADNLVFYRSDLMTADAVIQWPTQVNGLQFRDEATSRVFLWLAAKGRFSGGSMRGSVTLTLSRGGRDVSRDTLPLLLVGKLGDKNYFAGALDYLMERDRITGKPAKFFLDEAHCASSGGDGGVETFRFVVMRHALTEMNVLETYYANQDPRLGRIKNIFDAMDRNPNVDLIINGSFFQLEKSGINHGRRALGAVVNGRELSPASTPHYWQTAYQESGVSGTPGWRFKSFCLFQPDPGPGRMALVEEPYSPHEPYVPRIERGSESLLPYMALGGLHQAHEFENNPGCNTACMGFVEVAGEAGDPSAAARRLIWIAATDTDPAKTTSRYGGEAFRQALRDSGLIIEEGNPRHGVGPGRCDLVYFDSANSVALAYKVDGVFQVPCVSGRHLPNAPNTLVNNYLMLTIAGN